MFSTKNAQELRASSYECVFHKPTPMSGRVAAAIVYMVIRAGEIIDWWFPVKVVEPVKTN